MLPTYPYLKLTATLVLALGTIALALLPISQVSANGPHVGAQEVFSGPIGPYDLRVFATPTVGNLHITTFVSPLGNSDPVSDALVQVSGQGPQGASLTVGPLPAVISLTAWHGVYLFIEEAGEWIFTVTVESSLGKAVVNIPVEVQEPGSINRGVLGAVAFFLAFAAWLTFEWRRGKGKNPKPRRSGRGKR